MKNVAYSPVYIDSLLAEKDIVQLLTLIEIRERVSPLPKSAVLFCGLIYWVGSIRSGLYQYYEVRIENDPEVNSFAQLLSEFDFTEVCYYYLLAYKTWLTTQDPDALDDIEKWIEDNEKRLMDRVIGLLAKEQSFLKNNAGA